MARSIRIEYRGAYYHLMARGNRRGLGAGDLERLPGCDRRKVAIAMEIREKTAVKMGWMAENLRMKSPANASLLLSRAKRKTQA